MRKSSLFTACAVLFAAHTLHAQTDLERAAARDAATDALHAYEAGHYEQAVESVSRAEKLVHAPTHLLLLARAQAKLGQLVEARENYLKVMREPLSPSAPKPFVEAQASAQKERAEIDARVPSVVITVRGATAADATVELDEVKLPSAMIGIRLPVDPGRHVFKASSPTARSTEVAASLAEASTQNVTLDLVATGAATEPSAPSAAAPVAPSPASPETHGKPQPSGKGLRTAAYASFGVAAVGVGLGTMFLLKSGSTRSRADQLFDACKGSDGVCRDPSARAAVESKDSDANGQRTIGVAGLIVGGVGVATGLTLWFLDSKHSGAEERARAPSVVPVVGLSSLGLVGRF